MKEYQFPFIIDELHADEDFGTAHIMELCMESHNTSRNKKFLVQSRQQTFLVISKDAGLGRGKWSICLSCLLPSEGGGEGEGGGGGREGNMHFPRRGQRDKNIGISKGMVIDLLITIVRQLPASARLSVMAGY